MYEPAKKDLSFTIGPNPFIGFAGQGSRVSVVEDGITITVRASWGTRLQILLLLAIFGPGLSALLYSRWELFREKPGLIIAAMFFGVGVGWLGFIKYLVISVGRQRLEFRTSDYTLRLIKWNGNVVRTLSSSELPLLYIRETILRVRRRQAIAYTLSLRESETEILDLATTDQPEKLQEFLNLIRR